MDKVEFKELMREVKNEIPILFQGNRVDETILLPTVLECLRRMGIRGMEQEEPIVLKVSGNCAILPENFRYLCLAVGCFRKTVIDQDDRRGLLEVEKGVCKVDECDTFRIYKDDCGMVFKIDQYLPYESYSWDDYRLLSVEKTSYPKCKDFCPNRLSQDPNEISIRNGKIYTNFPVGYIYLEYISYPKKGNPLIPSHEIIRKWIKAEMIKKAFGYMYMNGEPNFGERYKLSMQQAHTAELQAISVYKSYSFKEWNNLGTKLTKRYTSRANPILRDIYC